MKTMKQGCAFVLIGAAFAAHAQAASTLTRAEVRHELVELQAAGYRTSLASSPDFPDHMQAIMRRAAQAARTPATAAKAGKRGIGQTGAAARNRPRHVRASLTADSTGSSAQRCDPTGDGETHRAPRRPTLRVRRHHTLKRFSV